MKVPGIRTETGEVIAPSNTQRLRESRIPEPPNPSERTKESAEPTRSPSTNPLDPERIRRLLQSPSPEDRRQAFQAIWELTDRSLKLELLKSALNFDDDYAMHRVILGLGQVGGPEAGEVLVQILKTASKSWVKEQAAGWLGNTGGPGALEALLEAYQTDSLPLQVSSAGALYKLGYPGPLSEVLPKVGNLLDNPDGSIRRDAAEQLSQLASAEALPLLTRALQDSNGDVRIQAIRALRTGKVPGAAPLVENLLADPNPDVAYEAKRTLAELRQPADEKK